MPFSITNDQDKQILKLEGAVTIRDASVLLIQLEELLEDGTPLGVDTSGLADTDTCILQLLCSLRKTAKAFSVDNPSQAFTGVVDRCGLRRELLNTREDS